MTSEEKTNAIGESLNLPTNNSPTSLIATFADVNEVRESKIQAFAEMLEANQNYGSDVNAATGSFNVTHKGIEVHVRDIEQHLGYAEYHEVSGKFWEFRDYHCQVVRIGHTRYNHNHYFVADSTRALAVLIIELMDDMRYCALCGALFDKMKGKTICHECALSELPIPCRTCGKKHGRNYSLSFDELPEHAQCKERRLGQS